MPLSVSNLYVLWYQVGLIHIAVDGTPGANPSSGIEKEELSGTSGLAACGEVSAYQNRVLELATKPRKDKRVIQEKENTLPELSVFPSFRITEKVTL